MASRVSPLLVPTRTRAITVATLGFVAGLCTVGGCYSGPGDATPAASAGASGASGASPDETGSDSGGTDGASGGSGGPNSGGATDSGGGTDGTDGAYRSGIIPLRRLSTTEYSNTLVDLFGLDGDLGPRFAADVPGRSSFPEGATVSASDLDRMYDTMASLAARAIADRWDAVVGCDERDENACADAFIANFGRRVYRHPLSALERADLRSVYDDAGTKLGYGFRDRMRVTLIAMLMSPRFHYHWTLGDELPALRGSWVELRPYEVASRLSYFVWQSMPDEALFTAAESESLSDPRQIVAQAERMLRDPERGPRGVAGFFRTWLHLDALASRAEPRFATMTDATLRFATDRILGDEGRDFGTLLTADFAYVNEALAEIYGLSGITGPELRTARLDPNVRAGILTQPGFLAATSDTPLATPIRRGRFLYERLVTCRSVPPPMGAIPEPPPREDGASVRQQLERHRSEGVCRSCHQFMDPLGLAFVGYDEDGRHRDVDAYGQPADASGVITGLASGELSFRSAPELARRLATTPETQRCMSDQIFRYALRTTISDDERASADLVWQAFAAEELDLKALWIAPLRTVSFTHRRPAQGEVLQ